jgi:hypothetical protein
LKQSIDAGACQCSGLVVLADTGDSEVAEHTGNDTVDRGFGDSALTGGADDVVADFHVIS